MAFPVVVYGCESRTIKKTERWRIDAFELWCWRRRLRVPSTAGRSNQSILKETSLSIQWKDWCWSWNSNTLATWCEELIHLKRPWCWERLKEGGEGNDRGWDGWMASLMTQWTWVWVNSGIWWWTGRPCVLWSMGLQRVGHDWATELNWTELRYLGSSGPPDWEMWYCLFTILSPPPLIQTQNLLPRPVASKCSITFPAPLSPGGHLAQTLVTPFSKLLQVFSTCSVPMLSTKLTFF